MGCLPRLWSRLRNRFNRKRTRLWTRQRSLAARNVGFEASNHELQRTIQSNNKSSETASKTRLSASLKNNTNNKVTGTPSSTNVANNEGENEIEIQGTRDSEIAEIVPYSEAERRFDKILSSKDEATFDPQNDLGEQEIYPYPTPAELEESVEIEVILSSNSPQSGARKYQAGKYIGEVEDNMNSREKKVGSDKIECEVPDLGENSVQDVNDNRVTTSNDLITYNEARSDSKGDDTSAVNYKKDFHLLDVESDIDDVRFSGSTVKGESYSLAADSDPLMTTSGGKGSSANKFDSNNTNDQNEFLTKDNTNFKNLKRNENVDNHNSRTFKIEDKKIVKGDEKLQVIEAYQEAKIRDYEESELNFDSNSNETVAVRNVKDDSVDNESEEVGTEHASENFIEDHRNSDDNATKESSEEHTTGSNASTDDDDDDDDHDDDVDDDNDDDDNDGDADDSDADDSEADDSEADDSDADDSDADDCDADDTDADNDVDTDVGDDDDDREGDSKKDANENVDDDDSDNGDGDDDDDHVFGDVAATNRQDDAKYMVEVGASETEKKGGCNSELENSDCKENKEISNSAEQGASGFGNPSTELWKHTIINNDIEVTLIDDIP